jgi:hypothetical protein
MIKTKHNKQWRSAVMLTALAATFTMAACDDDDELLIIDPVPITGAVAAFADSTVDFGALQTFAMPDTIVHFAPATGTPLAVPRTFDETILDRVRNDFLARGYVDVTGAENVQPDFVVLVGATATENRAAFVSYPWYASWGFFAGWGWYAPGFDNSWTIVYPWAPHVTVASYPRGTLIVELIPTLSVNPLNQSVNAAWAGVATAVLNGQGTDARLNAAIDQMFNLSPYLHANQINPL